MALKKAIEIVSENNIQIESAEDRLTALLMELEAEAGSRRRYAASELQNYPQAREHLLKRIDVEQAPEVIESLFNALANLCDDDCAVALLTKLKSEDAQIRNCAIELLQTQPELVAAHIEELMADDDPDVRIFAMDVIGAVCHPSAVNWLHHTVLQDTHINVVGTAIDKLAEIGTNESLPVLQQAAEKYADQPYIIFAIQCVRHSIEGAE